jgi:tetratricopeptide (TPR) repeat protein
MSTGNRTSSRSNGICFEIAFVAPSRGLERTGLRIKRMSASAKIIWAAGTALVLASAGLIALGLFWFQRDRAQNLILQDAGNALAEKKFDTALALYDQALRLHLSATKASEAYYGRANAETEKARYDEAIRDFSEALKLNPKMVAACWGRGYASQLKGDLDNALRDYAEYVRSDQNAGRVYFNRGLIYLQRKEWAKAVEDFSESIRCEPENSYAYFDRGSALAELSELDGALASLDAAISIDPTLAEAYRIRATVHRKRGELDRAQSDELLAAKLTPPTAPSILGPFRSGADLLDDARLAETSGRYDEAIDLCDKALATKLRPFYMSNAYMTRGNCYAGKGDWDKALRDYDEAVQIQPNNYDALVNRGNAYAHKKERDKSTRDYDEALRLNPKMFQAYCNRAMNYLAAGDLDRAFADLTESVRLNPKFAEGYARRSIVLLRLKHKDEALADADSAVRLAPDRGEPYLTRGRLRSARREFSLARADFERALERSREPNSSLLNSLAWFFATCPDPSGRDGKKAVQLATKGCELTKWKDAHLIDTLAAALAETGDYDQAIERQSEAIKLYEGPADVRSGMEKRLKLYRQHHPCREEPGD